MFEPTISLAIILIAMTATIFVLAITWDRNSLFRSFFVIVALWLLFLDLNITRHGLDTVEDINVTKNVYNLSGVLIQQENTTSTEDPRQSAPVSGLLDSANFYWLLIIFIITLLEIINLVTNAMLIFGKKGDPAQPYKPL